jgi:penicillin-binding protein 2
MISLSNQKLENKILLSRLKIAIFFMLLASFLLIARIYNLQITQHKFYSEEALGNQMRTLPIPPNRGKIFDRDGNLLAGNQLAFRLTLTPEKVKNIDITLQQLKQGKFITQDDIKKFHTRRNRYKKFHNIPIKDDLSQIQMAKFLVSNRFNGIDVESYFYRVYPNNESSIHAIGYVSRINKKDLQSYDKSDYIGTDFIGKTGIEKQYETLLHGKNGLKQIERNVSGRVVDETTIRPAIAGKDLYLSINLSMQKKAESLLKGRRGAIVVVDVRNGEVLTLVSTPVYNPNWFVKGISVKNYKKLQTSKDIPQLNRATQGLYPPGSTVKPFVALAGLEEGLISQSDTTFCPGYYQLPNVKRKFNDWKRTGHNHVDVKDALAESCDVFFYELANKMGIETLHDNLDLFNLGRKTGVDLPGERGGILPNTTWKRIHRDAPWYKGETLIVGIGQGFMTASPLQLAVATAALANKGRLFKPKLLKNIQTPDGVLVQAKQNPSVQIPIKNIRNWESVIDGMRRTVYGAKGTARRINKNLAYTIAGKTGTAQVFGLDAEEKYIAENLDERLRDHALFTGFAPIDRPEIAISVIVENAGSGSAKAAPLARAVLDVYFNKTLN